MRFTSQLVNKTLPSPSNLMKARSQLFGWYLFDFATSFLMTAGGVYFAEWVVRDNKTGDAWFNLAIVISTILCVGLGPLCGFLSDRSGRRRIFLALTSGCMFAGTIGIYIASHFIRSYTLRTTAALISFVLTLWAFQVGLIPYNALLGQIVPKERYGTVSGIGTAFSWLGGVLGILFTLPFVTGKFWHISPGRDQAFLPSALAFGVFAIFSLILLPSESEKTTGKELSPSVFRNYWISASHVLKEKPVCLFLISFMLISDALLTIQNNASIYLTKAMRLSDVEVALCFLSLMVGAAIGGVFSGYLYSRIDPKRLLLGCLFLWPVLLLTVSRIESHIFFFVIFPIVGVLFGATFSICRVLFLLLAPSEERALHFGFYASFERTASIIGPAVWTGSLAIFADNGGSNYRIALLAMAGMAALAIPFMLFVRGPSPPLIVQQTIAT